MKKKYLIFVLLSVFFIASCSLKAVSSKREFMLNPTVTYTPKHRINNVIEVAQKGCDSRFASQLFYYRKNGHEFEPYATVGWIEPVCSMFETDIINSIQKSGIFKFAQEEGTLVPCLYKLTFNIVDLEPVFENKNSYILADIRFNLFDENDKPVDSYTFKRKIKITDIDPENIVNNINIVVGKAIVGMLRWLDDVFG